MVLMEGKGTLMHILIKVLNTENKLKHFVSSQVERTSSHKGETSYLQHRKLEDNGRTCSVCKRKNDDNPRISILRKISFATQGGRNTFRDNQVREYDHYTELRKRLRIDYKQTT